MYLSNITFLNENALNPSQTIQVKTNCIIPTKKGINLFLYLQADYLAKDFIPGKVDMENKNFDDPAFGTLTPTGSLSVWINPDKTSSTLLQALRRDHSPNDVQNFCDSTIGLSDPTLAVIIEEITGLKNISSMVLKRKVLPVVTQEVNKIWPDVLPNRNFYKFI